ncbi:MAG: thiamine diphosphokinase [Bdellovibrionota bacterium]
MKPSHKGHKEAHHEVETCQHCVVVCSQSLESTPGYVVSGLSRAFSIAVDGGLSHFKKLKLEPMIWVGDRDSLVLSEKQIAKSVEHFVLLKREKTFSDLEAALAIAEQALIEGMWRGDLILLAAQGGRLDHELVNLLVVHRWLSELSKRLKPAECPSVFSYGSQGVWVATNHEFEFDHPRGAVFSVVALASGMKVSISGAKYNLKNKALEPGALGLSNVGTGKSVKIKLSKTSAQTTGPVFIFMPHLVK